jgi:hypothetical protein
MKLHGIPASLFKALNEIKLAPEWSMIRAEIQFERKGVLGEWATVIWDPGNAVFYVKTNKAIVYPDDTPALLEAVNLMNKANEIVHPRSTK